MTLQELRQKIGQTVSPFLSNCKELISRSRRDEKLFRDPIFGFQRIRPYEVFIIDSPLFQRLRRLSQTALAYYTYPASIHSRFEHSINCLNLAERILTSLKGRNTTIGKKDWAEVRLASLLHDIGHCIFSHGSEFFYRDFDEFIQALEDSEVSQGIQNESELVNYCILTSDEFYSLLWKPIVDICCDEVDFIGLLDLKRVAQMIIGIPPDDHPENRFLTEIVNGPLDVDKLDYLTRDAYFTGISLSIDIERLLPSFRTARVKNEERKRKERRLVVDHRGIAVVEQLLFARMVLYDTVYHHHKVRSATATFQEILKKHSARNVWPTTSGKLNSIIDFLEIDENEFFGNKYTDEGLQNEIRDLRCRVLPERALVIAPRTLVDEDSHTRWSNRYGDIVNREDHVGYERGQEFFNKIKAEIVHYAKEAGADSIQLEDVIIDVPEPPKYSRLGRDTLIQITEGYCEPLRNLFPFQKVVTNYSNQYKYRTYVFAKQKWRHYVSYAAFRAFGENGINLHDLSLILAHQDTTQTRDLIVDQKIPVPDWRSSFYVPDSSS